MTSRDFCYWLQGFFELTEAGSFGDNFILNPDKVKVIKKHLNLVFTHEIDPSMGDAKHQKKLNSIHHGSPNYMWDLSNMSEEELDEKYGEGVRPRC